MNRRFRDSRNQAIVGAKMFFNIILLLWLSNGSQKLRQKHQENVNFICSGLLLIFCTYSGPQTGINEAIPAGKFAGQFFEHLGLMAW
ncbi:MAG: hypothetical protein NTY64_17400 [Deltaproteobacteria bacterium]|nr:hypothetical protein [Deltaproteobacteria bacterium]